MHKAFEYEVKYDRSGKPTERRWSAGPILVTTAAGLILGLTGNTIWSTLAGLIKAFKGW